MFPLEIGALISFWISVSSEVSKTGIISFLFFALVATVAWFLTVKA
jgi:hypothetical protein